MNYTPKTHELFNQIVPGPVDGIHQVAQVASGAPEKTTATTGNGIDGFMNQAGGPAFYLYENIPGLY